MLAFNVPVGPRGAIMPNRLDPDNYDEVTLIVDGFPASRSYFLENPTAPLIRMMWPPKVMVRPELIVRMTVEELTPLCQWKERRPSVGKTR